MPALLQRLVNALRPCGRPQEAIARAERGLERFPGFTDLVFDQALASLALGREDDAIGYWERCIEMGDAPPRFGAAVGGGTYLPRISLAELHARRGELEPAQGAARLVPREHPDFFGVSLRTRPRCSAAARPAESRRADRTRASPT